MFDGRLYDRDGNPVEFYADDPATGRRVPIELRLHGPQVLGVSADRIEGGEPILPDQPGPAPDVDRLRTPMNVDDFTSHAGEPEGAAGRRA